uniref:Uncharacterized protein n=1 Tax=Avena sativa TaxID=4498 RepID=A0ACD5YTU9_AVESA
MKHIRRPLYGEVPSQINSSLRTTRHRRRRKHKSTAVRACRLRSSCAVAAVIPGALAAALALRRGQGDPASIMASLAESFLADLDELSDNEACQEEENAEAVNMEEDVDGMSDLRSFNYDLDSISKLQKTQYYNDIMQNNHTMDKLNSLTKKPPYAKKVEDAVERGLTVSNQRSILDNPEYQLIVDCNALSVDIDCEITIVHSFIRDKYKLKLPLLESRIQHPIDYACVVKKIGNEMDLTRVELKGLLPSADIMWVTMTESTTSREPLSEGNLVQTIEACDRALILDAAKKKILDFVASRMRYIAPNLAAIVGSYVASKLMVNAGGLEALAKMPSCNVQLLGANKKHLSGFSTATFQFRAGYVELTEVFQSTPISLRARSLRLVAAKSTLAARIDCIKENERYAQTDMMKFANRMQFVVPEKSSLGDGLGKGYGLLGQAGSGKLRVSTGQSKLATNVAKSYKEKNYGSSGVRFGLTSSLAFTPVQGMELSNLLCLGNLICSRTGRTYFSDSGAFLNIRRI